MASGESWTVPLRRGFVAGAGIAALLAAGSTAVRADQANNHSDTAAVRADQSGPLPAVAPVTASSSDTTVAKGGPVAGVLGGPIVAPATAGAVGINVACPASVVGRQRDSGSCTPGDQSNGSSAGGHVTGDGRPAGTLTGGPIVLPLTGALGLNLACLTDIDVLGDQRHSRHCVGSLTPALPAPAVSPAHADSAVSAGSTAARGQRLSSSPTAGPAAGVASLPRSSAGVAATSDSRAPVPPATGASVSLIERTPAPGALGLLAPVVLVFAAVALRRLRSIR